MFNSLFNNITENYRGQIQKWFRSRNNHHQEIQNMKVNKNTEDI